MNDVDVDDDVHALEGINSSYRRLIQSNNKSSDHREDSFNCDHQFIRHVPLPELKNKQRMGNLFIRLDVIDQGRGFIIKRKDSFIQATKSL